MGNLQNWLSKMVEHHRTKSTQPNYPKRWPTLHDLESQISLEHIATHPCTLTGDFSTTTVSPARVSEVGVGGAGTTAGPKAPAGVGTRWARAGLLVGMIGLARTS